MDVYIHISGTASDVSGIFSVTMFRNTVSESRMVTPEKEGKSWWCQCRGQKPPLGVEGAGVEEGGHSTNIK